MRVIWILNILLFIGSFNLYGQDEKYNFQAGLYFSSREVIKDERTSLNLTPDDPFKFSQGFSLEFDAQIGSSSSNFGYIFRIIANENTNLDLVYRAESISSNFGLSLKDRMLISYGWEDIAEQKNEDWLNIKIDLIPYERLLKMSINGVQRQIYIDEIESLKTFNVLFGASRIPSFFSSDVCRMLLRNIKIYNSKGKLFRYWTLQKHNVYEVYDDIEKSVATVENPIWYIDKHVKWEKEKEFKIQNLHGITSNAEKIFLISDKAVFSIHTDGSMRVDTIPFKSGKPYENRLKQIIYNPIDNKLWSYVYSSEEIRKFDFNTREWTQTPDDYGWADFGHHNKLFSPVDSNLVTIMGYGHYTYKSTVNIYSNNKWTQIERSDQIEPRYLASAGFKNDHELLVFGGYGSKSGKQELSPGFYYDLYVLDLNNYTFDKIMTYNKPVSPFVPFENLIYDSRNKCFYTLGYNSMKHETSFSLIRASIEKPEMHLYSDSIKYKFLDSESNNSLFLNSDSTKLIALTANGQDVSIHTIAYPPLMQDDVYQTDDEVFILKYRWILRILGIMALLVVVVIYWKYSRKGLTHQDIEVSIMERHPVKSSIIFLGGFQIYNHNGNDITSGFSPTLKQLFLFIFLSTVVKGKGVSSGRLDDVLWYDKSKESARNNRNVNISKLRTMLEEFEGVEISNDNTYWKITVSNTIYCDYIEVLTLLKKEQLADEEIIRLINILKQGELLPGIQTDWIDPFKSSFINDVIDGLMPIIKSKIHNNNPNLIIRLSDSIFIHDPLNEDALIIKCGVLDHAGKKSLSRFTYDSFCKEYKQIMGVEYNVSLNDIIGSYPL